MWPDTKNTTAAMWYSRKPNHLSLQPSPMANESMPPSSSNSAATADGPQPQPSSSNIAGTADGPPPQPSSSNIAITADGPQPQPSSSNIAFTADGRQQQQSSSNIVGTADGRQPQPSSSNIVGTADGRQPQPSSSNIVGTADGRQPQQSSSNIAFTADGRQQQQSSSNIVGTADGRQPQPSSSNIVGTADGRQPQQSSSNIVGTADGRQPQQSSSNIVGIADGRQPQPSSSNIVGTAVGPPQQLSSLNIAATADGPQPQPSSSNIAGTADGPQPRRLRPKPHHPTPVRLQFPIARPRAPLQPTFEQRNWLTLMAENLNAKFRRTTMLECTQGELNIRFCSTCNVLWPLVGNPPTHKHNKCVSVNSFFPQKTVPTFVCYICQNMYTLRDIGKHVVAEHLRVDINRDVRRARFCVNCDTIMCSPLSEFVQHSYVAHGNFRHSVFALFFYDTLKTHLHKVLAVMAKLARDFQQNGGRQTLMFACMFCTYVGKEPRNPRVRCNFCEKPGDKFYCKHCNAIFSSSQIAYDIHRLTNQHVGLMRNDRVASNAVRANTGGGDDSGHGR